MSYIIGGFKLLTADYLQHADDRMHKYHTGRLKYDQMDYESLIEFAATTGAFVVSGAVATGITVKLASRSLYTQLTLSGAAAGYIYLPPTSSSQTTPPGMLIPIRQLMSGTS